MFKTVEDFQAFNKGQFEAATQSATALAHGLQQMVSEASAYSKQSFESGNDVLQKLFSIRSVEGALQVQIDYAKASYESAVSGATKMTGLVQATAQDVLKPIEGMMAQVQSAGRAA